MNAETTTAENWTSNPHAGSDIVLDVLEEERLERTKKNIRRRAAFLWKDGYTYVQAMKGRDINAFYVTSPKGDRYLVKLTSIPDDPYFGDKCNCQSFTKYGLCKHHLAVLHAERKKADAAAQETLEMDGATDAFIAEQEALRDGAEDETWGCDPYAEL